ncbi:ferroxidase fet3 [Steccherinum ochraceum]|uniref:Ferroxidase fet3 n=1 Tax=Steccherinum ochraceum TaxID=92696 RepID=A0A4R0RCH1_9APHY|nr:ferroxidase fet3 [Steccherinum ochraceum]
MRSALTLLLAASPALAALKELWWNITYVEDANPDGLQPRRVVGVNGTWPPPPMDINQDDLLIVHAHNSLDKAATLHHHGMFFNSTSWFDGAQGVTQCTSHLPPPTYTFNYPTPTSGIPPNQSFDYVVPVNTSGQWGTYWTHAHASGEYVDGLRTPFVIHATNEPHAYDDEYTVVLGDWYHDQHEVLLAQFINVANPGGAEPVPDSGLMYFAQNGSYLPPIPGRDVDPVTSAVGFNENATLPFQPGKTYRLRIVNTSAFAAFFFWIDGHEMQIIEADGTDVEPYVTDLISVTVAQRYSILVTARNDTSSNWAIHANMDSDMFDTIPPALNPNVTSSITYAAGAPLTDSGFIDAYHDVADLSLVPLEVIPLPAADRTIELEVSFDTLTDGTNHAMFNLLTYNMPTVPSLFSQMSLGANASDPTAYGPYSFVLEHNEVVDIVLKNGDAGKHPFHMHGHKFQLVGRAEDYTSDDPTLNPPLVEGQANPMRRDTVQVPSMNSVTLRIVADNPGSWFFHCHIEWHLEVGLAVVFIEAPQQAQERNAIPQVAFDQCKMQGIPTVGNAAGFVDDPDDLKGLPAGPFPQKLGWRPKGIWAMTGCVLTAVIGMLTVTWYALGGFISDEEMEHEARVEQEQKDRRRGKLFSVFKTSRRAS